MLEALDQALSTGLSARVEAELREMRLEIVALLDQHLQHVESPRANDLIRSVDPKTAQVMQDLDIGLNRINHCNA